MQDLLKDIHNEEPLGVEIVLKGRFKSIKDKLLNMFNSPSGTMSLIEIKGYNYDTVKVDMKLENNRTKVIDLSDYIHIRHDIDVTTSLAMAGPTIV